MGATALTGNKIKLPQGLPAIEPYLARPRSGPIMAQLEAIFFETSGTKTFASSEDRAAFRERWLGRYLAHDAQHAFLAVVDAGLPSETLAGYLVGSIEDPALATRFDDLGYFKALSPLTARFPAQLHVNLAPSWQGRGVGRALVESFCQHLHVLRVPGVHLFTGRGMRNVRFYERAGFREAGSVVWNGREIVMLVRDLT
jgi:GNAT superfamily N-acetyltransferase